jgi:hypothetical protein
MWQKPIPDIVLDIMKFDTQLQNFWVGKFDPRVHADIIIKLEHGIAFWYTCGWQDYVLTLLSRNCWTLVLEHSTSSKAGS